MEKDKNLQEKFKDKIQKSASNRELFKKDSFKRLDLKEKLKYFQENHG